MNVLAILRILFLSVSFYGYLQYLQKAIRPEFALGLSFCTIGSILFLAGMLNILPEATWVLFLYGLLLAFLSFRRKDRFQDILTPGILFFLFAAFACFFLLYGSRFTHYDNFSHWALAPKLIIENDRFPSFMDTNFYFYSYPLGSSVFIYYFSEISGLSAEWFQMYIQVLLMLGMLTGLFTFTKTAVQSLFLIIGSVFLLCSNVPLTDLLVDTLLSLVGLFGVLFIVYYRDMLQSKLLFLIPCNIFLISIKNSGIFFLVILFSLAWYYTKAKKTYFRRLICTLLPALISLILWQKHAALVFANGLESKHTMSISNFVSVFSEKQLIDIATITSQILQRNLTFTNPGFHLLLIMSVILLFARYVLNLSDTQSKDILILSAVSYLIYQIGILCMYLFSMPDQEALRLASYNRYHSTILTFLGGLALLEYLLVMQQLSQSHTRHFTGILLSACILVGIFHSVTPNLSYLSRQSLAGTDRERFDYLASGFGIDEEARYAIIVSSEYPDPDYLFYLSAYSLNPISVSIIRDTALSQVNWDDYDYILLFEETEVASAYLTEVFPKSTSPVIYLNMYRNSG